MRRFRGTLLCLVGVVGLVATACIPPTPTNVAPTAVITASPDSGDAPLSVTFSPDGSTDSDGTIASYAWDFGDGSPAEVLATGDDVTHEYTAEGTYTAELTVTDNLGATKSATALISVGAVNVPPSVVIAADPTSGKAPLPVQFTGSGSTDSDGTVDAYEWDFGDSSPVSTEADPEHTYSAPGLYTAQLTITDDDGATATDTVTVTVVANQAPTAVASADVTVGKFPLAVQFTGSDSTDSDGSVASHSWNFGDGTPVSTLADPAHSYANPGSYTATLTVTDDSGDTATATVAITVNPNQAPTAVANATPTAGQAPLTINFSSAASVDPDGTIVSRSWNFGDGNSSNSANPTYLYGAAGTYTATLTVTDDNGATDTDEVTIEVSPIPNVPPTAAASGSPTSGKEPLTVTFSSAGSTDSDGTIVSRSWDFGDGGSSTAANPSHTYTTAGTFVATLTVTDNAGGTDTATVETTVTPNQAPTAVASGDPLTGKEDLTVNFSSAGSADPDGTTLTYAWDFGDGGSSTVANPSHTYTSAGTFDAELTVTDSNGATAIATVTVTVIANQAPVAAANATPQSGARPLVVAFSSAAAADPDDPSGSLTFSWAFGDGGTSTAANPSHTYTSAGTFTAVLTVTDPSGASDTDSVVITVVVDDDGDGVSPPTDCNDNNATVKPGAPDPLGDNVDQNCDGGDGVLAEIVYVRSSGGSDSSSCASATEPCATIGFAQSRAQTLGRDTLVVAGGTYARFSVTNGIDVRGGFGQNFLRGGAATGSTTATVNGSFDPGFGASAAIIANGINTPTLIADLTAVAANESANDRASYGVIVRSSTAALTMDTLKVVGGVGGNGQAGGSGASAPPTAAPGGGGGQNGDDSVTTVCSTSRQSGGGGATGAGSGGAGGQRDTSCSAGTCGTFVGGNCTSTNGLGGGNASVTGSGCGGGGGGGARSNGTAGDGGPGQGGCVFDGSAGGSGIAGNGAIVGGLWTRNGGNGGNGTLGGNGGGGGGGGGGGASDEDVDDLGAGGGGGGAGGSRAGAAGFGGTAGHASIAVLVSGSSANLVNFEVTLGNGGGGGAGGNGGAGQPGGPGGSGGSRYQAGGAGGNGGNGGRGGHAGAGGGGAGGPSFGIVTSGSTATISGTTFVPGGNGGSGGAGGVTGLNGGGGQSGPKTNTVNL